MHLLTKKNIYAIMIMVRVPTMEYGGSLKKVKEVIVNAGLCYI